MITHPLAGFALLVARAPPAVQAARLPDGRALGAVAAGYRAKIVQTVAHHDAQWLAWPNGTGTYRALPNTSKFYCDDASCSAAPGHWPVSRYESLPFNQQNALGRTLVALAQQSPPAEAAAYAAKAEQLARYWKGYLHTRAGGALWWAYWGEQAPTGVVDTPHAFISVWFALDYFRWRPGTAGGALTAGDMQALARTATLPGGIWCGPPANVSRFVAQHCGDALAPALERAQQLTLAVYAPLSAHDGGAAARLAAEVYRAINLTASERSDSYVWLGLAFLAEYQFAFKRTTPGTTTAAA